MKQNIRQLKLTMNVKRMTGAMLLEVVLAIAVFAFGMLALVQLQGNLTRSSADANTRTVATNIAEEIIEDIRGYEQVPAVGGNDAWEYLELVGTALTDTIGTVTRGGIDYTVTAEIKDFWRDDVNDTFDWTWAEDPPDVHPNATGGPDFAAFKLLKIDVTWNTNQEFYVDDANTADLGDNKITLYQIIPSSPPILGAKIAADPNAPAGGPVVDYTPGFNPDIAALRLDNKSWKESTTPIPDIIRSGELTETYFEVVTYNIANIFLRREEFLTVGCECILNPNNGGSDFGLRPTLWNGVEYTEADKVYDKNVGVSANNQQSVFCDICCRDHHDGGTGINDDGSDLNGISFEDKRLVYDPWTDVRTPSVAINPGTDHDHFTRSKKGVITVAQDRDTYLEACRMVRKDGFFRVAQDFNQRGFFGIVEEYMDNAAEVAEYSEYITTASEEFYEDSQADFPQPGDAGMPEFTNPADGLPYDYLPASKKLIAKGGPYTNLPTNLNSESQQLRSRGVYPDYMTDEVEGKIATCLPLDGDGNPPDGCQIPRFTSALGTYPFFEVQLTKLSNWTETRLNEPVDVTNEAVRTNNAHSRGRADLKSVGMGNTASDHGLHKGNVGIAATDPIRMDDPQAADENTDMVYISTEDFGVVDLVGFEITGEILSGVGGVKATDVELSFNEAQCGRTPTGYRCVVPEIAIGPTLTVSNYYKANQTLYACSPASEGGLGTGTYVHGADNSTTFDLKKEENLTANIVIEDSPCAN